MQYDISNPSWVRVVETRVIVDGARRGLFSQQFFGRSLPNRDARLTEVLEEHLYALMVFADSIGKNPDTSRYIEELLDLIAQKEFVFSPLLSDLPAYHDLISR